MKPIDKRTAPDGLILMHKRPGVTSFDALRDIKRQIGSGKAGHTGTLDKFAEGLLLVLTGRALRLSRWFTHCDKRYEGTIHFGVETDTIDPEGGVIASAPLPSRRAVEQALSLFRGNIEQEPPAYSAIHVDGERASTLARRGEVPEMRGRQVTIYRLELLAWEPPYARIFVHCSSGTYIRSLARDIALAAGSRGYLTALLRTQVAGFKLEDATLGIGGNSSLLPIEKAVFNALNIPCIDIPPEDAKKAVQGKPLAQILMHTAPASLSGENAALFSGNAFIAMVEQLNNQWNYGFVYGN